jgi:hypothetical protein
MEKLVVYSQKGCSVWVHRTVSGGAPESVRCARPPLVKRLLSGLRRRCTAINHPTVRWCTGLSGEPFTGEVVALGKRSTAYGYKPPDCPVAHRTVRWRTGLSGEPIVSRANGRPRNPRATRCGANGQKGHRTVSGAPTALNLQRSASPKKERNPHQTVRCARRQKARFAFLECSQRLLAALGL